MRPYNGRWGVALGLGAFGWGRKRLAGDELELGSAIVCEGGDGTGGVGMTLNVVEELNASGDLGVYGGGGA